MKLKGLDFLDKVFAGLNLSSPEQAKLDTLLYGEPLPGAGPWAETKKGYRERIIRHIRSHGLGRECPTCKEIHKIPK